MVQWQFWKPNVQFGPCGVIYSKGVDRVVCQVISAACQSRAPSEVPFTCSPAERWEQPLFHKKHKLFSRRLHKFFTWQCNNFINFWPDKSSPAPPTRVYIRDRLKVHLIRVFLTMCNIQSPSPIYHVHQVCPRGHVTRVCLNLPANLKKLWDTLK